MILGATGFQDSAQPRLCWNKGFQITQLLGVFGVLSKSQEEEEEEEKEEEEEQGSKTVRFKDLRVTDQDQTGTRKAFLAALVPPLPLLTPRAQNRL